MASETPDLMSAARAVMVDGARLVRDSASASVVMFVLRGLAMRVERVEAMSKATAKEHKLVVHEHHMARIDAERAQRDAEKRAAYQQGQAESVLATLEETRAAIDEATGSAPRSAYAIKLAIDRVKEGAAREATKAWCDALEPVTEMLGVERPGGLAAVERIRSAVHRVVDDRDAANQTVARIAASAGATHPESTSDEQVVEMVQALRRERDDIKSTNDDQHRIALERVAAAAGFTNPSEVDVERMVTIIERMSMAENRAASTLDAVLVALGIDEDTSEDAVLGVIRELVDDQRNLREMIRVLSSEIEFVERHEPHVLAEELIAMLRRNLGATSDETLAMCAIRLRASLSAWHAQGDRVVQACRILGAAGADHLVDAAHRVANERQQASAQAARAAVAIQDALLAAGVASDRSDLPKSLDDLTAMLPRLSSPTVDE